MGAQISTNLSSGCSSREQRYLNIKSKAHLGRYIKYANKSTLMVINFTTTWCQPCKDAEQPMRKLAEDFPDVKFARVDIDLLQDVVKDFDLKTMPTFLLCKKVDDGPDKGNGAAEVGGGNGSGNRTGDNEVKSIPKAKQDNGLASVTEVKSATNDKESSATGFKEGNSVTASATQEKSATSVKEGNSAISSVTQGKSATSMKEGNNVVPSAIEGKSANNVKEANSVISSANEDKRTTSIKGGNSVVPSATEGKSADSVKEGNSVVPSAIEGKRTTGMKEGNSVVPSATQGKRTTSIKEGNNVDSSASEGKSATSVKEGNRAAAGATGGKSGTGVERAHSAAVSGSKGESTKANAKDGQRKALAPKGENDTSTVKEGNSVKNGDDFAVIKEPSPKRRTVNYAGKKVFIDEIDRMEGSLEVHELRKKIEYYKNQPTTASFKSTDEFYRYLDKSKPTQLMVINFTTEWCEPCKKAKDPFEKLSKFYEDVKFAKVDVDVLMNIAKELEVTMMPTFLLVKVKKVKEPEKEIVKKDGVQGDREVKKEPPEKEIVKKDGVQGDHTEKKKTHVLNKRYKMVELDQLVGWNDKKKGSELWKMIEKHRYTTT